MNEPQIKPFGLRLPEDVYEEIRKLADSEERSLNGQIVFMLKRDLRIHGK